MTDAAERFRDQMAALAASCRRAARAAERFREQMDEAMAELLVRGRTRVGDVEVVLAAPVEAVVDLEQVIHDGSLSQSLEDADRDGMTTHIYHDGARVASIVPSGVARPSGAGGRVI